MNQEDTEESRTVQSPSFIRRTLLILGFRVAFFIILISCLVNFGFQAWSGLSYTFGWENWSVDYWYLFTLADLALIPLLFISYMLFRASYHSEGNC